MLISYILPVFALSTLVVAQSGDSNCNACVSAGQAIANCEANSEQQSADGAAPFACICNSTTVLPLLQSCFQCAGAVEGLTPAAVNQYLDECKTLSTVTIATGASTDALPLPTDGTNSTVVASTTSAVANTATTAATTAASVSGAAATTTAATVSSAGTIQTRAGISLFIVAVLAVFSF